MWNTFKYTVLTLAREKSILVWAVLFPILLSTIFCAMFTGMDETDGTFKPVPVAVVDEAEGAAGEAFGIMMGVLSGNGGEQALLAPVGASTFGEARDMMRSGDVDGTLIADAEGRLSLVVAPLPAGERFSYEAVNRTILADVVDNYTRTRAAYEEIARANPAFFKDASSVAALAEDARASGYTEQVSITHSKTVESVRYYYALLGFAALMAAMVGMQAVGHAQANLSPLGARRVVGGTSRSRMLLGAIAGSWVLSFAAISIGFCYMRLVLGVDFGDRDAACILGIAVASLMTTSLGAFMGALPKIPFEAKGGLLSGVTCLFSLFAGLYGQPSMQLADEVARTAPLLSAANPAKQVSDLFYSLYVYTDLAPFFQTLGILLAITAVLALVAAFFMRRQSYAHL